MLRYRIRKARQQIGPWYATDDEAEQAAIDLGLARRDEHYDVLHLEPDVVIDCSEQADDEAPGESQG